MYRLGAGVIGRTISAMESPRTLLTLLCLLLGACSTTEFHASSGDAPQARGAEDPLPWAAPALERAISIRDGRTGEVLSLDAFLDVLAEADAVFLGETHIDETTHRVELAVYEGLLARRDGGVVLAMEMFERDVQPSLDAYLAGDIDEATFVSRARPWGNYRTAYRPLIERARVAGRPVLASNFPIGLRRRIAREGPEVLATLEGDAARQAPAELRPNTPAYWRRVENAVRSHRAMVPGAGSDSGDDERLYATQTLWDNAMGETCALAMDEHPGDLVLHVNGGFHSAYWDGTVRQLKLRKPDARVTTVAIAPVPNPAVAELSGAPVADYVVFAESRASDLNDGTWAVHVQRELEYRFHLPEHAELGGAKEGVPLLIWLSDDGLTATDGLDLWLERLGAEVAIAVLEMPYPEAQEDLGLGGRWFWPDSFQEDMGAAHSAVERVWGYLLRNFPIDPTRVCLAGEGTGATVVAALGVLDDRMPLDAVALTPRRFAKIKDFSLPLPEFRGDQPPPEKTLRVFVREDDREWWSSEIDEYRAVGLECELATATDDPWSTDFESENALRSALGLEARPAPAGNERPYVLVAADTPRARHWARLRALRHAAQEGTAVAVLDSAPADSSAGPLATGVSPELLATGEGLPRCPGPFGGTTVIVLDEQRAATDLESWTALEEHDPLNQSSRFHRLRIATTTGERSLPAVLTKLQSEGRKNVLIVPAAFCADGTTMRALERSVRALGDRMTLHWLPGLGGGQ